MLRLLGYLIVASVFTAQDASPFANDRAGRLLAGLLSPSEKLPPFAFPFGPRRLALPQHIEAPDLPLPPHQTALPRRALETPARAVRPHLLPEGLPLAHYRDDPSPPRRVTLPAGERVRLPSLDVNEPVALSRLATRPVDATPLDDPTAAASTAAALAAPPRRTNPAPFLRLTLPDPFEHRAALRLPRPDDAQPPVPAPVRPPEYKR